MRYKAFLSYSHAVDGKLAPALQRELQGFAKPLFRIRAISVFRDHTNLSVNPGLWASIEAALRDSEFFLLMASEASASSRWVRQEVVTWLRAHPIENLLMILTDGIIEWDQEQGDFDWSRTTALPDVLRGKFCEEPLYLDLRWTHSENDLSSRNPKFMDGVASIAATLRRMPKDTLIGEDVREHRKLLRLRWTSVSGLLGLFLLASTAAYIAVGERNVALVRQISAQAQLHLADHGDLACLLSVEATQLAESISFTPNVEPKRSLFACLQQSPHLIGYLHGHRAHVIKVKFSRHGGILASYDQDGGGILWDTASRRIIRRESIEGWGLDFTPDGRAMAVARQGKVVLEDVRTGTVSKTLDIGERDLAQQGFFSPDGRTLTVVSGTRLLTFDMMANTKASEITLPFSKYFVATPDSSVMARAENADLTVYRRGRWYKLNDQAETSIALSADGKLLASGGNEGVYLWNLATREKIAGLAGDDSVYGVVFSPDGKELVSTGWNGAVRTWDVESRKLVGSPLLGHSGPIYAVDISPDGSTIASGGADNEVILWDTRTGRVLAEPLETPYDVVGARSIAFSPDGKTIASCNNDAILLQDLASKAVKTLHVSKEELGVYDLAFDPAGKWLGSVQFGTVRFWRLDLQEVRTVHAPSGPVGISFSPDGRQVALVSTGAVTVWKVPGEGAPRSFEDDRGGWQFVRFSPDGKWIAAAGPRAVKRDSTGEFVGRGTVDLLDARTLKPFARFSAGDAIRGMAFSPNGSILATGSNSGEIILWEVATKRSLATLSTQNVQIFAIAFSPDGRTLATGGVDQSITLWDLGSRQPLGPPLTGNGQTLYSAAFSPNGKLLATNGGMRGPLLWDVDFQSWKARACRIANRQLTAQEQNEYISLSWLDKLGLTAHPSVCPGFAKLPLV